MVQEGLLDASLNDDSHGRGRQVPADISAEIPLLRRPLA